MTTWDLVDILNTDNGKQAGWCSMAALILNTSFIQNDGGLRSKAANTNCLSCFYQGSEDSIQFQFQVKRSRATVGEEWVMTICGSGTSATLTWAATTGVFTLTSGVPDTNCGTVGINTYATIKIGIVRSTHVVTIQVDANNVRTITLTGYLMGFRFEKWEGSATYGNWIRSITVNQSRPLGVGHRLVAHLDPTTDNISHVSPWFCSIAAGKTTDVYLGKRCVHWYNDGSIASIACPARLVSRIWRFEIAVEKTGATFAFSFGAILPIWFANGQIYAAAAATGGTELSAHPIDGSWFILDLEMIRSGANTLIRSRVNGGEWSTQRSQAKVIASDVIIIDPAVMAVHVYVGGDVYALDEGWITPTLTSPADISMSEGDAETLSWTPTGAGTYSITKDSVEVASGAFTNGVAIEYPLNTEAVGIYSFVCTITDTVDTATDTVEVTIASGYTPIPSGAIEETGSHPSQISAVKVSPSLRVLTHEPDQHVAKYQLFRKKW